MSTLPMRQAGMDRSPLASHESSGPGIAAAGTPGGVLGPLACHAQKMMLGRREIFSKAFDSSLTKF